MADLGQQLIDNSAEVLEEFAKKVQKGAEAIGLTAEKHAKANCPVDKEM